MNDPREDADRSLAANTLSSLEAELKALQPRPVMFGFAEDATQQLDQTRVIRRFARRQKIAAVLIGAAAAFLAALIYWPKAVSGPVPSVPRIMVVVPATTESERQDERQISIAAYSQAFANSPHSLELLLQRQANRSPGVAVWESVATTAGNVVELK